MATKKGFEAVAQRMVNAEEKFFSYAIERGFSREEAAKILGAYRKARVIKMDAVTGQFSFTHGVFGDVEIMRNALG